MYHLINLSLDIGSDGECPICAKLSDPETEGLPYNAVTFAAFEEAQVIMRGEIPADCQITLKVPRKEFISTNNTNSVKF